jgi:hypothetical protein
MSLTENLSRFIHWFGDARRQPDFTCGDCERVETCGLPPSQDCAIRLEQIERNQKLGVAARRAPPPYAGWVSISRTAQVRPSSVSRQRS